MYLHDINYLINLQDITITNFSISENQSLFLTATPLTFIKRVLVAKQIVMSFRLARVKTIEQLDI